MPSTTPGGLTDLGRTLVDHTRDVRESSIQGRAALRERVAVVRSAREARSATRSPGRPPTAPLCRVRLPADLRSAGAARRLALGLVDVWRVSLDSDVLALLVSEVAGNAVRHAGTPFEMVIMLTQGANGSDTVVRVEILDADPTPLVRRAVPSAVEHPDAEAESGRGLHLLDALAADWGTAAAGQGKSVWFDLTAHRPCPCLESHDAACRATS